MPVYYIVSSRDGLLMHTEYMALANKYLRFARSYATIL